MSGQIGDLFRCKGKNFNISAVENPDRLLNLEDFGISPRTKSAGCQRGYVALFEMDSKGRLILSELRTNNNDVPPPEINGVQPKTHKTDFDKMLSEFDCSGGELHYSNLNLPIQYTGDIIIVGQYIDSRYIHMGFPSLLSYREVYEIGFTNGKCQTFNDVSKPVAKRRRQLDIQYAEHNQLIPAAVAGSV
jgi:hypothetical protein